MQLLIQYSTTVYIEQTVNWSVVLCPVYACHSYRPVGT